MKLHINKNQISKLIKYRYFWLIIVLTFGTSYCIGQSKTSPKSTGSGVIEGRVIDFISGEPLANVKIEVYKRKVDILPSGAKSIRSMKDVKDLGMMVSTDENGEYKILVLLDEEPNFFLVTAKLEGYEKMLSLFVRVEPNGISTTNFSLAKENPTEKEKLLMEQKGMAEKVRRESQRVNSN